MKTFSADYCLSFHLLSEKVILVMGLEKDFKRDVWKILLAIILSVLC